MNSDLKTKRSEQAEPSVTIILITASFGGFEVPIAVTKKNNFAGCCLRITVLQPRTLSSSQYVR